MLRHAIEVLTARIRPFATQLLDVRRNELPIGRTRAAWLGLAVLVLQVNDDGDVGSVGEDNLEHHPGPIAQSGEVACHLDEIGQSTDKVVQAGTTTPYRGNLGGQPCYRHGKSPMQDMSVPSAKIRLPDGEQRHISKH